jgi:hypothetical protein
VLGNRHPYRYHTRELGLDGGEGFPQGSAGPERFLQEFDMQAQGLQRIADFMRHGGGQLTQDDQELGALFCGVLLGAPDGIPENTDHKEFVLQQQGTETHVEGEFLAVLAASREGVREADRSLWGHERVRPLPERGRSEPLRQEHREGLAV